MTAAAAAPVAALPNRSLTVTPAAIRYSGSSRSYGRTGFGGSFGGGSYQRAEFGGGGQAAAAAAGPRVSPQNLRLLGLGGAVRDQHRSPYISPALLLVASLISARCAGLLLYPPPPFPASSLPRPSRQDSAHSVQDSVQDSVQARSRPPPEPPARVASACGPAGRHSPCVPVAAQAELTMDEVKAAFRRQAMLHHPDRSSEQVRPTKSPAAKRPTATRCRSCRTRSGCGVVLAAGRCGPEVPGHTGGVRVGAGRAAGISVARAEWEAVGSKRR